MRTEYNIAMNYTSNINKVYIQCLKAFDQKINEQIL